MSVEDAFDRYNEDADDDDEYHPKSDTDSDSDSLVTIIETEELVQLYREQAFSVQELLSFSDDEEDDIPTVINAMELVQLYKDQATPIQVLSSTLCNSLQFTKPSSSSLLKNASLMWKRGICKATFILCAIPVAITLVYIESVYREKQNNEHDEKSSRSVYKTWIFGAKVLYSVFTMSIPVMIVNYRYKRKIDAFVQHIIKQLQMKMEYHVKYPQIHTSAAVSVSHIRSRIVDATDVATIKDWQCVVETIDAHPLIKKSCQEERGDFVEYWELIV